jgi:hypothetical protein
MLLTRGYFLNLPGVVVALKLLFTRLLSVSVGLSRAAKRHVRGSRTGGAGLLIPI